MSNKQESKGKALEKREIVDGLTQKIGNMIDEGMLQLPENYSAPNALKAAWLAIQETEDRNKKPALEVCTRESVANALLTMVVMGLNPAKQQCYFVVYGKKLLCQRSYMGTMKNLQDAYPGAKVAATTIYKGDTFEFDIVGGRKQITKHTQSFDSLQKGEIAGAYCIIDLPDGTKHTEIMTLDQIRKAWEMGQTKGKSPAHQGFPDRMAEKTVISRACWRLINASDDQYLVDAINRSELEAADAQIEEQAALEEHQQVIDVGPPEETEQPESEEEQEEDETEPEQEKAAASGGPSF